MTKSVGQVVCAWFISKPSDGYCEIRSATKTETDLKKVCMVRQTGYPLVLKEVRKQEKSHQTRSAAH